MDGMTWHRPEYRGREAELISLAQAGRIAKVNRSAVTQWTTRHEATFPDLVLSVARQRFIVAVEFQGWLHTYRQARAGNGIGKAAHKPKAKSVANRTVLLERRIDRLETLAQQQQSRLSATRNRLAAARYDLAALPTPKD